MRYSEIKENIQFKVEIRGYHHGQSDMTIRATIDNELVGLLHFVEYQKEPSISMIEVSPQFKRKGVARSMVYKLQELYPEKEIDWGMLTDDGSMLYNSLDFIEIPIFNEERYNRLKKKYEALNDYMKDNWGNATDKQKNDWYRLDNMISTIEDSPEFEKRVKRIIKTN